MGEGREEEQELSGRWGSPQCEPQGWPWPTWCCPAGVSLGLPPSHCPACASVGPRRLGRVPTAPGRPFLPPRAGGVASPRGPRGHAGDAGGGLAAAPCLRQRGPDLLEALDGCPQQVRSWSPGRWPRGQRTMGWWPLRWALQGRCTVTGWGGASLLSCRPMCVPKKPDSSAVEQCALFLVPYPAPWTRPLGLASEELSRVCPLAARAWGPECLTDPQLYKLVSAI